MIKSHGLLEWWLGKGKYYLFAFWVLVWIVPKFLFEVSEGELERYLIAMYDMPLEIIRMNYPRVCSVLYINLGKWISTDFYIISARIVGGILLALLLMGGFRNSEETITT